MCNVYFKIRVSIADSYSAHSSLEVGMEITYSLSSPRRYFCLWIFGPSKILLEGEVLYSRLLPSPILCRLLVGMRWWNNIKDDGSNEWMYEAHTVRMLTFMRSKNVFCRMNALSIWRIKLFFGLLYIYGLWHGLSSSLFTFFVFKLNGYYWSLLGWHCLAPI